MAFGSLLLFLALLVVVALIVSRPLVEDRAEQTVDEDVSHWLAERERILDALAELDADWQLGKVPEEIYASQRAQLVAKGAAALQKLEKANQYTGKLVKRRNRRREPKGTELADDDLERMIADYKARHKGGS